MLVRSIHLAIPMFALATGVAAAQPVIVAPTPVQSQVFIAPTAPPPPRVETVPPPPPAESQVMYLATGPLGVGRRELELGGGPIRAAAGTAGDLGARSLGAAADRRLRLGGRALGRLTVARLSPAWLALPAVAALVGCVREHPAPQETRIIVQPPAQPQATAIMAPGPPPPPQSELVPPPPPGAGPVVWQPGHWILSGSNWATRPVCATAPGRDDLGTGSLGTAADRRLDVDRRALGLRAMS